MAAKVIDWEAIEPEWRAGVLSKLQISQQYDVSRAALDKHFAKAGIERDLGARIRAKADSLVTQDAVTREVTVATKVAEKEIVEANAELQARVRREQRTDITRSRKLVMSLLAELEAQTGNLDLFERLAELLMDPDGDEESHKDQAAAQSKRWEAFNKAISLSARTGTMKSLADSLKTLVALEREAFGIDQPGATGLALELSKIERIIVDPR